MRSVVSAVLAVALDLMLLVSYNEGAKFNELETYNKLYNEEYARASLLDQDVQDKLMKEFDYYAKNKDERIREFQDILTKEITCVQSILARDDPDGDIAKLMLYLDFLSLYCDILTRKFYFANHIVDFSVKNTPSYPTELVKNLILLHSILDIYGIIVHDMSFQRVAEKRIEMLPKEKPDSLTGTQITDKIPKEVIQGFRTLRDIADEYHAPYYVQSFNNVQNFVKSVLPAETEIPSYKVETLTLQEYNDIVEIVRRTGFPDAKSISKEPGSVIVKIIEAILEKKPAETVDDTPVNV